jgi:pterin-4a-carbinolamine dehydratase
MTWQEDEQGHLEKNFAFKNYRQSFAFTSQIALLAEKKKSSSADYLRL